MLFPPLPYNIAIKINHILKGTQGLRKKKVPKVLRWPLMYYFTGTDYTAEMVSSKERKDKEAISCFPTPNGTLRDLHIIKT